MSASKSRKKPSSIVANLHENLVNSPYLGKSGAGVPRVRQLFQPAPSTSDIFRGFIDPKYAIPILSNKRSKQPNYRTPTFTSLNRKAHISNALKSQTVSSSIQKSQPSSPIFPAKRQKSVIEANEPFSRESYDFAGLIDPGSPRKKTAPRKRGDHNYTKAASAKGSSILTDVLENAPAYDEGFDAYLQMRGRRASMRKRKPSLKGKTMDDISSFVNEAAVNEIEDFLGSPLFKPERSDGLNKRALRDSNIYTKSSKTGIPPVVKNSSLLLSPEKDSNYDDLFVSDHPSPSPKHEYPILNEVKEAQSKEALIYVQNALSAWLNYKDNVTPVVSNTIASPNESKKSDTVCVAAKRSVTKTAKVANNKKRKSNERKTIAKGNTQKSDNALSNPRGQIKNSLTPSTQNIQLDINGNVTEPTKADATPEESKNVEILLAKELGEESNDNSASHERLEDKQEVAPIIYASISTQALVPSAPISIQVGKSLTDLVKTEVVTVEEDCQTEPDQPKIEEFDLELISVSTQTNPSRRKKPAALCPPKIKRKASWKIPFSIEVENLVSETMASAEENAAVETSNVPISTFEHPNSTVITRDINNNETEVCQNNEIERIPTEEHVAEERINAEEEGISAVKEPCNAEEEPFNVEEGTFNSKEEEEPFYAEEEPIYIEEETFYVEEESFDAEEEPISPVEGPIIAVEAQSQIIESWEKESGIRDQRSGSISFPYLNGQISTVGCTATVSSETSASKGDSNCNCCEGTVDGVGYVKSYERDVVPLIDACSNQGDPNGHTVGVSGVPKTWSFTCYNHPIQNQCLGQRFRLSSVTSLSCHSPSPAFAASTQTLNETHAECQVGSSFRLYPLTEFEEQSDWIRPMSDSSDNFLNPESLLKMSDNVRQVITDLDLGTNIENTLDTITKTFSALSEIVTDLVNPDDESVEVSSEEDQDTSEQMSLITHRDIEMGPDNEPSQILQVMESVCCSLDPTLSETTY